MYIVDLNASTKLELVNVDVIKKIRESVDIDLIYGGGIRTISQIQECFDLGMNVVVLGVSAELIYRKAVEKFGGEKIMVSIRSKDNEIITDKKLDFPMRVIDFAETLTDYGVTQVMFKDEMKEGTQIHPNFDVTERLILMTDLKVYASGGIGKMSHLKLLKKTGVTGAVIGKALYERNINLEEAITQLSSDI